LTLHVATTPPFPRRGPFSSIGNPVCPEDRRACAPIHNHRLRGIERSYRTTRPCPLQRRHPAGSFDPAFVFESALWPANRSPPKSRRPAFQRAFEGEKAHGHCAVGLELFPRPQSSGVFESSQAGKAQFTLPTSLFDSATCSHLAKSLQKFSTARVTYDNRRSPLH
jgi:hypothetical protein